MDRTDRVSVIQAIFGCGEEEADKLAAALRHVQAKPNSTVAFQGDESSDCRFVVSGAVGLRALGSEGQYTQLATVETGEVFGAFPSSSDHTAEVVAQDAAEMLVIGTAQLRELANNHAAIASGLAALFAKQLSNVLGRLAARVTLTAKGRVYSELLAIADANHTISPVPNVSSLGILAQTARETASRAISDLERRGVLERRIDHWQIIAPRMLEDLVH